MRNVLHIEDIARFWSNVKKGLPDECWPWQGTTTQGYGEVSIDYIKWKTHRLAWTLFNGPIPDGAVVRHTCDSPGCCNPFHLKTGTPADNSNDMVVRGRSCRGAAHWSTKLSDDDIRAIRKDERTQTFLAALYKTSQSVISRIKTRKAWSHVSDD